MKNVKSATLAFAFVVGVTGPIACERGGQQDVQESEQAPAGQLPSEQAPEQTGGATGESPDQGGSIVSPTEVPSESQDGATGDTVSPTELPLDDGSPQSAQPGDDTPGGMLSPGGTGGEMGTGAGETGSGGQSGGGGF